MAIFSVICLLIGAGEWLFHRNMRVFLTDATVGMVNMWGKPNIFPLSEFGQVMLSIKLQKAGYGTTIPTPLTTFLSTTGETLFSFRGKEIRQEDIQRLCSAANVPLTGEWPTSSR